MAIKPSFLSKYSRRYTTEMAKPEIQAGMAKWAQERADENLEDQFSRVFSMSGDTATINLYGPMSQDGPDWIDIYLGYGGTAYKNLIRGCQEILKTGTIKTLKINANTPGGNIDGLDVAYLALKAVADSGVEIIVYNYGDIASAGVWYLSCANKIIAASPSAMAGSIGVVIDTLDFTGYYNSLGIERLTITNTDSQNKRPDLSTEEGQKIIVKELDALYGVFVSRVTDGRTIGAEGVKKLKGEMVIAAEAVKIGLMDSVEGEASASSGSNGNTSTKIQSKELSMEADVQAAFDKLTEATTATNKRLEALESGKATPAPGASTPEPEKTGLSAEDKTFCSNIINGGKYTSSITAEAVKVLSGDSAVGTLKAMVAGADTAMELNKGKPAGNEGEETKPEGSLPGEGEDKYTGEIKGEKDLEAELARQGVEL